MWLMAMVLAGGTMATPAQQQQAAGAVFGVFYHVKATGSFTKYVSDEIEITEAEDDNEFGQGTAFSVDPDGWLITARHVGDMQSLAGVYCETVDEIFIRYRVDRIQMQMTLVDIVGHTWKTDFIITPAPDSSDDICHTDKPLTVQREWFWPIRVVAVDDVADLALLKLDQKDGAISFLKWGSVQQLAALHPVYAFGFPGAQDALAMRTGLLSVPCEPEFVITHVKSKYGLGIADADFPMLSRYLLPAKGGMSGGPILAGDEVVGIITHVGTVASGPDGKMMETTLAVPGDYAQAWYRWTRGQTMQKPTETCEPGMQSEPLKE